MVLTHYLKCIQKLIIPLLSTRPPWWPEPPSFSTCITATDSSPAPPCPPLFSRVCVQSSSHSDAFDNANHTTYILNPLLDKTLHWFPLHRVKSKALTLTSPTLCDLPFPPVWHSAPATSWREQLHRLFPLLRLHTGRPPFPRNHIWNSNCTLSVTLLVSFPLPFSPHGTYSHSTYHLFVMYLLSDPTHQNVSPMEHFAVFTTVAPSASAL